MMKLIPAGLAAAAIALLLAHDTLAADPKPGNAARISGFRGDGSGVFATATPPVAWDAESKKNILWTVKIGKSLHSSPVVAGDKIFLLSDPNVLTCLDANTGKELWSKTTAVEDLPAKVELVAVHPDVGNTTPSPVCDGRFVYIALSDGLVSCFDLEGNRKWITFIDEPCTTGNGRSASPVLCDGKLILSMGKMIALDPASGKVAWKADKVPELYGTPLAVRIGDTPALVAPSGEIVGAADGSILVKAPGELMYCSPIVANDTVYFIDMESCAVPLAKDKSAEKKKWQLDFEGEFFASPVYHNGLVYTANNNGQLYVIDAAKGKLVYEKPLEIANMSGAEGADGTANLYPSLCVAGNHVFVSNDKGQTLVIEAGEQYKQVAKNALNETLVGTPAFAGKRIYLRTSGSLFCVGE